MHSIDCIYYTDYGACKLDHIDVTVFGEDPHFVYSQCKYNQWWFNTEDVCYKFKPSFQGLMRKAIEKENKNCH